MGIGEMWAWGMIYTLVLGIVFYSMGVRAGRADGYLRGRAVGMRIGADRQVVK